MHQAPNHRCGMEPFQLISNWMPLFDAALLRTDTTVAGATALVLIGQLTTNTDSSEGKFAAPFSLKNHRHAYSALAP